MANKYVPLIGGLDTETHPIEARPGSLSSSMNVFENSKGGYTTLKGYERYDGRPLISEATYWVVLIEDYDLRGATNQVVGDTLVLGGFDKEIVYKEVKGDGTECIFVCTGAGGETYPSFPATYGTAAVVNGIDTNTLTAAAWQTSDWRDWKSAVYDHHKALVVAPGGSGPILGVAQNGDEVFAWRYLFGSGIHFLAAYRSLPAGGWQYIDAAHVYAVDHTGAGETANMDLVQVGDTFGGGAYTVIARESFVFSGSGAPAADRSVMILKSNVGASTYMATSTTLLHDQNASADCGDVSTNYTWLPLVLSNPVSPYRINYVKHNFYGSDQALDDIWFAYGDGNVAMAYLAEFDVIRPISSNYRVLDEDITYVTVHNSRLILGTASGTILTSEVGNPTSFDGLLGAQEIGVGDRITGLLPTASDNLLIFTRNRTFALTGTGPSDWQLKPVSTNSGCLPYMSALIDEPLASDDRGIARVRRTDTLGGFDAAQATDGISSLFEGLSLDASYACTVRSLNQVRFFYGDRFLILTRVTYNANGNEGVRYGITEGGYDVGVSCVSSDEDVSGQEQIYFGGDDGYVYKMDSSLAADGEDMSFEMTFQYNDFNMPLVRKRYQGVEFMTSADAPAVFRLDYSMDDGEKVYDARAIGIPSDPTTWSADLFDPDVINGLPLAKPKLSLRGTGRNVSFSFSRSSSYEPQTTLHGYAIRVKERAEVAI